jgi:hypothetical protein
MGNNIGKEMLSKLQEIMHSKPKLVSLCGIADDATEADLSDLGMDADDAMILASELPDKGALSVLNLASNNLGELVLPEGWTHGFKADYSAMEYTNADGRKQDAHPGKPEGIIAVANAISDMGALLVLSLKSNNLRADGGKALAEGLKGNQVITELDIADNNLANRGTDMSGVVALADAIPGMGAISTVIVNTFPLPIQDIKSKAELDFSGKGLKVEDAIIIAALIPSNVSRTIFGHPYCH